MWLTSRKPSEQKRNQPQAVRACAPMIRRCDRGGFRRRVSFVESFTRQVACTMPDLEGLLTRGLGLVAAMALWRHLEPSEKTVSGAQR